MLRLESDLYLAFSKLAAALTNSPPDIDLDYAKLEIVGARVGLSIDFKQITRNRDVIESKADTLLASFRKAGIQQVNIDDGLLTANLPFNHDTLDRLQLIHAEIVERRSLSTLDHAFGPGSDPITRPDLLLEELERKIANDIEELPSNLRTQYVLRMSSRIDELLSAEEVERSEESDYARSEAAENEWEDAIQPQPNLPSTKELVLHRLSIKVSELDVA